MTRDIAWVDNGGEWTGVLQAVACGPTQLDPRQHLMAWQKVLDLISRRRRLAVLQRRSVAAPRLCFAHSTSWL